MKKFFLLAAAIGITSAPATAASINTAAVNQTLATKSVNTWTASDVSSLNVSQTKLLTSTQLKALDSSALQAVKVSDLDTTTIKSLDTATLQKFTPVQRSELLQLQLADDSINELTINRADLVIPNKELIAVKKVPCVEFDDDVVEAADFKVKYEIDDNGFKTATLTEAEFKPFVSVKTHPQLYKIENWDPEVEEINPLKDRVGYCTKYSSKCKLDTALLTDYTKKVKKLKLCDNIKVIPIRDMKCVGVKCGEGQECEEGCCKYQTSTKIAATNLNPLIAKKYEIKDAELIATPVALEDGTAKLVFDNPVISEEILDEKIRIEKATVDAQSHLKTLKVMSAVK